MGSLGVPYYVQVDNVIDIYGNMFENEFGNRLLVTKALSDLDNVIVYPNPYNARISGQPFRFANLPKSCEIYIFSAGGRFIRRLVETDRDGGVAWDLRTEDNHRVGSGVYFYVIRLRGMEVKGKFVIIN